MSKKFFFTLSFIFIFLSVIQVQTIHAQTKPWWLSLEQGKLFFRSGAYGDALNSFDDARRNRLDVYTRLEDNLIIALSAPELRRFGDTLDQVEVYCSQQHINNVTEALNELYYRFPKDNLDNSVKRVLEEIDRLKSYPEAEYWIGETYMAEGELGLALNQFQKAHDLRSLLEIPEFDLEIMYRMADVYRIRQDYQKMENCVLDILDAPGRDVLWAADSGNFARAAMMRILENEGIGRFFTLYRYDNYQVERAHRFLGLYYYTSSRHNQAAEHLMFAFLIQNTMIMEEVIRHQFDFTFTTMDDLMTQIAGMPAIQDYMEQTDYFRTAYFLAVSLYATGRKLPAGQLWTFLANTANAGEWQVRSRRQLQSPYIDPARQMP
ncbi:MAG: hypothetical protein FWD78_16250 [Treponema sp.]|nr:hypothetical protein [Treponema sp.]